VPFHGNTDPDSDPGHFAPYRRDPDTLARPWVAPGTPGLAHRIGGIEKADISGNISYDPDNHQRMTELRRQKILNVADAIAEQTLELGDTHDDLLVVGWGSTYGALYSAVENLRRQGMSVAYAHLRHLWPLARNLGDLLQPFERILVPELNTGQLLKLLRAEYCVPAQGLNKIAGKPFKVSEAEAAIRHALQESIA
jgi:2-oxoglutarate ferredoxin oxidoreductase subunit alpha